jgi:hypothetical protein
MACWWLELCVPFMLQENAECGFMAALCCCTSRAIAKSSGALKAAELPCEASLHRLCLTKNMQCSASPAAVATWCKPMWHHPHLYHFSDPKFMELAHVRDMLPTGALQIEDETYQLRPMNCPFHVLTYKQGNYSYRDLPLRWAELGTVYRYERSGTMHGLFRVRGFTQVCVCVATGVVAASGTYVARSAHVLPVLRVFAHSTHASLVWPMTNSAGRAGQRLWTRHLT